jgi:hypothetical protein
MAPEAERFGSRLLADQSARVAQALRVVSLPLLQTPSGSSVVGHLPLQA